MAGTSPAMTTGEVLSLPRHRHSATDALGPRESGVALQNRADARADIGRKRRGLPRGHIDMHGHVLRGRRQPAVFGVTQLLEGVQPLLVRAEQPDRYLHGMAEMDLAQVP